ncbi:MAG TPA: hypothetical protein VFK54_00335 [Candidatus Limnocylindrales bacterium]|nr:hypothetical protein [Candidatus Limnocylindrales bacterium]
MDTRLHQFLSTTISPAYADEARRRLARKLAEKASRRPRRPQLNIALRHTRRPASA